MLKLYNSLTKKVTEFKPLTDIVRVYSCRPTVYDNVHIGNLSSFIFADNINRSLELSGFKTQHVMNITDIDDKTIKRSITDYPDESPENSLKKLTNQYEDVFKDDIKMVGIRENKFKFIRATESITIMQRLISDLLSEGFAYITDDGIYFSIEAYQKSGKKYGQLLNLDVSNTSRARINNDEYDKHSVHDFALWKFIRPDEPAWSYMIADKDYLGRPGWHIECSAMSMHLLGEPFDIHTGGIDLIFPHHENEIAQSTAGKADDIYAKFFCHNEHLLINKQKMSKSLDNFLTLKDLKQKELDPLAFRLLILQSHYRNQANFSWEILEAANSRLTDLRNFASLTHQTTSSSDPIEFGRIKEKLIEAFLDDLNTPKVLAILSEFQNSIKDKLVNHSQKEDFMKFIELLDLILGLNLVSVQDVDGGVVELLKKRKDARSDNNWAESDEIRDSLTKQGIGVRDTPKGQVWYFI